MKEDTLDQSLENGDKCHGSSVVLGVHQPLLGGGSAAVDTREGLLKTTTEMILIGIHSRRGEGGERYSVDVRSSSQTAATLPCPAHMNIAERPPVGPTP